MELTGAEVLNVALALGTITEQPLYVKSALKLRRTRRSIADEAKIVEEARLALLDQYAEKDDNDELVPGEEEGTIKLADPEAFTAAIEELFAEKIEVKVEPVSVEDLGEDVMISTDVLDLLMDLNIITE